MGRFCAVVLVLVSSITAVAAQESAPARKHAKPTTVYTPGVTTITSFDKDHTVIGWLEIVPFESKIYHQKRTLRVLVPANYFSPHNAHRSYPVLYMQDAQNLFDLATSPNGEWRMDETVEHLVGSFKIPPMFIVGIDNAGDKRSSEYLPYPDSKNKQDNVSAEADVSGKEYERFVLTEVMPFIEKHYRVSRGASNTGIGGSGYGADAALYIALEHPTIFGHVLVESPVLWIGDGQLLKDAEKARELPEKMIVGIGTSEVVDGDPQNTAKLLEDVRDFEGILRKKGMTASRLKVEVDEGAQNNEAAWSKRLPDDLVFLYGSK